MSWVIRVRYKPYGLPMYFTGESLRISGCWDVRDGAALRYETKEEADRQAVMIEMISVEERWLEGPIEVIER